MAPARRDDPAPPDDDTRAARFERATAAIDAAHAADPRVVTVRGRRGPLELLHAELASDWVLRLSPEAGEPLLLAARGHHLRRWEVPRNSYPPGRAGYLRWRRDLQRRHADDLARLLSGAGYDDPTVARVGELVRKEGLGRDPEVQVLEDALCLVFLETQLGEVAGRLQPSKAADVLTRTLTKMSPAGRAAAASLPLPDPERALVDHALSALAGTTAAEG